jgi:hypothetical protein
LFLSALVGGGFERGHSDFLRIFSNPGLIVWRQRQIKNCFAFFAVILFFSLVAGSCLYNEHYVLAQSDQVSLKLQEAGIAVDQAFDVVLDAEKAGANVTNLLDQLNVAASYLAQAENYYRTGDSNNAATQAGNVLLIAQQVTTSAQNVKQTAEVSGQNVFWLTFVFAGIGASLFVAVLFLIWRKVKRGYMKKLFGSKPVVVENTA